MRRGSSGGSNGESRSARHFSDLDEYGNVVWRGESILRTDDGEFRRRKKRDRREDPAKALVSELVEPPRGRQLKLDSSCVLVTL